MRRPGIGLLSGILLGAGCAHQALHTLREPAFFTTHGVTRDKFLGLPGDTLLRVEAERPYYQDELGYAYRFVEGSESLQVWVEYYTGQGGVIQAVSITYESQVFRALTKRYEEWRTFLRGVYGAAEGHVGQELWQRPDGGRVRLLLSPDRHYLQVTFSITG